MFRLKFSNSVSDKYSKDLNTAVAGWFDELADMPSERRGHYFISFFKREFIDFFIRDSDPISKIDKVEDAIYDTSYEKYKDDKIMMSYIRAILSELSSLRRYSI